MIQVKTIGRREFHHGCGHLLDLSTRSFHPDLVVGIRSGGWCEAEEMRSARNPSGVVFLPLTCRRPTSDIKAKSGSFKFLLKHLPYGILNLMRLVEYYALTLPRCRRVARHGPGADMRVPDPEEISAIQEAVGRLGPAPSVLVVDDSLDSGATLANVLSILRQLLPTEATLRIAAFTVLGPTPVVDADFFLYRHVNCRFPWSYDFHG